MSTESGTDRHAWSRPDVEPVAPGVLRVPLPLPMDALRAVNVYVLVPPAGSDDLTIVDGGWSIERSREVLGAALDGIGAGIGDIRRFLVTHMHRDHYSQAAALRRAAVEAGSSAAPRVALGAGEAPSLASIRGRVRPFDAQLAGLAVAGAPVLADQIVALVSDPSFSGEDVRDYADPDDWLSSGDRIHAAGRTLTAFETPGHTLGHMVFSDDTDVDAGEQGMLFAGDHVLPHITPSLGFDPAGGGGSLTRYLASLAAVRAQPDRRLLPAHGPVTPSVHARVDELLAHHEQRLDEVERRVAAGASTAAEVAAAMRWTRRETPLDDLDVVQRMLAVLETDAHLEVLAAQGRVPRAVDDSGAARHHAG